ncbi:hypothetical protein J2W49_003896 [Hydrogenophaga palleronii]|uniref:Photosynthesis system II assembly factor Ycf48/Hcf136-like domain-containing protein n=1 Tax=Hydrogenophaga palleronii TaxID=65655 RepID=A0ABU1WRI7_9BURK|nr:DUF1329 domain-containing protein [Hydrogenophaga palleronii]MDR7151920.1 hypothetical protein [Hydrogenophaga palleronii]
MPHVTPESPLPRPLLSVRCQRFALGVSISALTLATPVMAQSADALSTTLTAVGAERAANKDGSIPAWVPEKQGEGWGFGKLRKDHWKYRDDKPLYTIDASNVDKYADKLSPGQVTLIKQTRRFDLNLYHLFQGQRGELFASAEQGKLLKSTDAGRLWSLLDTGCTGSLWAGVQLLDGTLLVGGLRGTLLASEDQGVTWAALQTDSTSSITGLRQLADGSVVRCPHRNEGRAVVVIT